MHPTSDYREQHRFVTRFAACYVPWFAFTTAVAASPSNRHGTTRFVLCTLAILFPVAVFAAAYRLVPGLRAAVRRLDLSTLHFFQIARLAGIGMLALYAVGRLAAPFALWAGGIDVIVGLSATFVAFLLVPRDPMPRRTLIAWNVLGLADFVVAFALWFLWSPTPMGIFAYGSDTAQMLVLPLSFIPLGGVPVAAIVHVIALLQLRANDHDAPHPLLHPPRSTEESWNTKGNRPKRRQRCCALRCGPGTAMPKE